MFRQTTYVTAVARALGAPCVGCARQQLDLGPARAEQRLGVRLVSSMPRSLRSRARDERRRDARRERGRRPPARRGGGAGLVPANHVPSARARPSPSEAASAAPRTPVEPALGVAQVARVDAQARRQRAPGSRGGVCEQRALGPGRLGIDVVGRHGRDAAEVVDAGLEQARELRVREVRRRLYRNLGRHQQARDGDRPEVVLERRLRRASAIFVPGLARKFCTITSCR